MNKKWLIPQITKLIIMQFFYVDPLLYVVIQNNTVPYGLLWQVLNPFAGRNEYLYKYYLLFGDSIISYFYSRRLGKNLYWLWQSTDICLFCGLYQDITITWFSPLGVYYPIISLLSLIQKLPIGYFPIFGSHFQCALYCNDRFSISALIRYSIILGWTIIPPIYWYKKRHKKKLIDRP